MSLVVLVTGSRNWADVDAIALSLLGCELVIHGGAPGADTLAGVWARAHGVACEVLPADWALGRRAGPERNGRLVARACHWRDQGRVVKVSAFPLPGSRGTWECVRRARKAGLPVHVWGRR